MKKSIVAMFAICAMLIASCGGSTSKVEDAKEEAQEMTDELMNEMDEATEAVEETVDTLATGIEETVEEVK